MIQCIDIDDKYLYIEVVDGRIISTPLTWYKSLMSANPEQRANYRLIARNTMIEWSEIDLHLDIEEMFSVDVGNTEYPKIQIESLTVRIPQITNRDQALRHHQGKVKN